MANPSRPSDWRFRILLPVFLGILAAGFRGFSQALSPEEIRQLVQDFKKDERGPYQAIRWFCPDGTILPPQERCPEPGGIQHALPKNVVQKLAGEQGIYLGQILAGAPFEEFWDEANRNSRLKQYQLEKYLQAVDDGWILRRARYYRGAIQAEDEERWGINFLTYLAGNDEILASRFFLLRQACKDIPHRAGDNRWQKIRALSTVIGDSLAAFTNLRVKLHNHPEPGDLDRVKNFRERNQNRIPAPMDSLLKQLIATLELAYRPFDMQSLAPYLNRLPKDSPLAGPLQRMIKNYRTPPPDSLPEAQAFLANQCADIAELMWALRKSLPGISSPKTRLSLLDLSNEMETLLFRQAMSWNPQTVGELLQKNYALARTAAGAGYLEIWEWESVEPHFALAPGQEELPFKTFWEQGELAGRVVEWGTGMIRAIYEPAAALFGSFEPLTHGFIDDRVRGTALLPLGETVGKLKDLAAQIAGLQSQVAGISNPGQIRGLNPGFAKGELVVVAGAADSIEFSAQKIYLLQRTPFDLKPVAGIGTAAEGNLVSHVQLLARNLGIPNAVFSPQHLEELAPYSGQSFFYAVSPRGRVILKPESEMSREEKVLFAVTQRSEEKIAVPVDKLRLDYRELIGLGELRASDSGRLCGPKAANLGELKYLFPGKVAEGFAIPFGIFRQHLDQPMPGSDSTYWEFLQTTFRRAAQERKNGAGEESVENRVLLRLAQLREAIRQIPLLPEFDYWLRRAFEKHFGTPLGRKAVFIRSDTNMEDLKDFTGAGLNLTVFNVVEEEKILQGIRDVWASPYSERSYRWRQKYLLNPENVYPSILILPTVNVDKSGVMITSGMMAGAVDDITVAFNRGAGGAVEGQIAETYLLRRDGTNLLLSPSREVKYTLLPESGGTEKGFADFHRPILEPEDLAQLRAAAAEIKQKMAETPGIESGGPFDVELGFMEGKIFLFQIRPFVENKRARSSLYLQSLDPELPENLVFSLHLLL
ncbi:MAG: phosphoenolpyruvate synthase [Calditrichaceae bacterium]|nr:PEP/pyruvate-binding domain-containing protein [Calditrichia bacterium]NUQ40813.1 phosphoenolpyruvate synthase [Calditrichaceae bacterium]